MGGTNTRPSVFDGLVCDGKFSQVVSNHFGLDFDLVEGFAIIDSNNGSGHLRNDNHISQVSFHTIWFFICGSFLLLLAEFLNQSHGLAFQTTTDFSTDSAREQLHQLFIVHIQKLIKIDSSVSELTEGPLFLELSCGGLIIRHCSSIKCDTGKGPM